jgi:hypothetical protein
MLKYTIENVESGEVREWEVPAGEEKKGHRTLRTFVKRDLESFPNSRIEIEITGDDKNLVTTYKNKAFNYLTKANLSVGTTKKSSAGKMTAKSPVTNELEGFMKKIVEAHENGLLTTLEAKVMNYLMTDGYYAEYTFSDLEVSDIAGAIEIKVSSAKGVVGSLVKKNYLWVSDQEGTDAEVKRGDGVAPLVYATDTGYELSDEWESRWKPQI